MIRKIFTILCSIILVLGVIACGIKIAKLIRPKYIYVDMNDSTGTSYKCQYDKKTRDLRCMMSVKVKQYTVEK